MNGVDMRDRGECRQPRWLRAVGMEWTRAGSPLTPSGRWLRVYTSGAGRPLSGGERQGGRRGGQRRGARAGAGPRRLGGIILRRALLNPVGVGLARPTAVCEDVTMTASHSVGSWRHLLYAGDGTFWVHPVYQQLDAAGPGIIHRMAPPSAETRVPTSGAMSHPPPAQRACVRADTPAGSSFVVGPGRRATQEDVAPRSTSRIHTGIFPSRAGDEARVGDAGARQRGLGACFGSRCLGRGMQTGAEVAHSVRSLVIEHMGDAPTRSRRARIGTSNCDDNEAWTLVGRARTQHSDISRKGQADAGEPFVLSAEEARGKRG
ncbi:hypothetical protein K438DRAFT_1774838 [Mycena galopus ATCC 62051]|nr:hypothetical protein K438DRAFT_1774838 [Mycena galopus ATCC 62051]